jgi:hypothetical protein
MRKSERPSVRGAMRARCIDRPQFGQAGPAVIGLPAGRNEFCIANMVYLLIRRLARFAAHFQTDD